MDETCQAAEGVAISQIGRCEYQAAACEQTAAETAVIGETLIGRCINDVISFLECGQ